MPARLQLYFVAGYIIKARAQRKAREAVRSSSVKIRGNDVIASVKVLTALWLVPLTYIIYAICAGVYAGSFIIGFIVWLLLPFFSYVRCAFATLHCVRVPLSR